jgi:hypothetical protein
MARITNPQSNALEVVIQNALVFPDLGIRYMISHNEIAIEVPTLDNPLAQVDVPSYLSFHRLRFHRAPDLDARYEDWGLNKVHIRFNTFVPEGNSFSELERNVILDTLLRDIRSLAANISREQTFTTPIPPLQCDFEILRARLERVRLKQTR